MYCWHKIRFYKIWPLIILLFFKLSFSQSKIYFFRATAAQKMKFFIKDLFSKCNQIHREKWMWPHLLEKYLMENFVFVQCIGCCCAFVYLYMLSFLQSLLRGKSFLSLQWQLRVSCVIFLLCPLIICGMFLVQL